MRGLPQDPESGPGDDPMSETTIRLADLDDPRDLEVVIELTAEFKALDGRELTWPERLGLADQLRGMAAFVLLAVRDEAVVGMLIAQHTMGSFVGVPSCNIHDLYLVEEARGDGLGTRMMTACADQARATGCGKLTLEVNVDNTAGLALYRSLGFDVPEGEGPGDATYYVKCPLD